MNRIIRPVVLFFRGMRFGWQHKRMPTEDERRQLLGLPHPDPVVVVNGCGMPLSAWRRCSTTPISIDTMEWVLTWADRDQLVRGRVEIRV